MVLKITPICPLPALMQTPRPRDPITLTKPVPRTLFMQELPTGQGYAMAAQQANNELISLSEQVNTSLRSAQYSDIHWALQLHLTRLLRDVLASRERGETATLRAASLEHEKAQLDSKCLLEAEKGRQLNQQLIAARAETREMQRQLGLQQRRAAADVKQLEALQAQIQQQAAAELEVVQNAHLATQKALQIAESNISALKTEITTQNSAHNIQISKVNQAKNAEIASLLSQVSELRQERDEALQGKMEAETAKANAEKQQMLLQNLYDNLKAQHAHAKKLLFKKKKQEDAMRQKNERTKKDLEILQIKMNEGIGIPSDLVRGKQASGASSTDLLSNKAAINTETKTQIGLQQNPGSQRNQKQSESSIQTNKSAPITIKQSPLQKPGPKNVQKVADQKQQGPVNQFWVNKALPDSSLVTENSDNHENSEISETSENSVEDISAKIYEMNEQREKLTKMALQQMLDKQKLLEERLFAETMKSTQYKEANQELQKQMRQYNNNHLADQEKIKELVNMLKFTDKELCTVKAVAETSDKLDMVNRIKSLEEEVKSLRLELQRSKEIASPKIRTFKSPSRSSSSRSSSLKSPQSFKMQEKINQNIKKPSNKIKRQNKDFNSPLREISASPLREVSASSKAHSVTHESSEAQRRNEKINQQQNTDSNKNTYNYVNLHISSPNTITNKNINTNHIRDQDLSTTQLTVPASNTRLIQHFQHRNEINRENAAKMNVQLMRSKIDEQEEKLLTKDKEIQRLKEIIKGKNEQIESMEWPHQNRRIEQVNALRFLQ